MDLEFSPSILDTPSLMTPNIGFNPLIYRPLHTTTVDVNNDNDNNNNNSSSNPSSIKTTTTNDESSLSVSSAEIKLSKIEDDLKQGFTLPRKPTESPFRKMAEAGVLIIEKNASMPPTTDEGLPVDIPSTAEVMNVLESFSKYPTKDNSERDTTTIGSENNRFDTSPTHIMGVNVSPKKKLLIRSQSHTEPASPSSIPNNQFSQSQKNTLDDESSIDDEHQLAINNHFQRVHDLPIIAHPIDTKPQLDNNNLEPTFTIQTRTDPNVVHQTLIKQQQQQQQQQQQPMIFNNKRTLQQTITGPPIIKGNSIIISQPPNINEVTSSDQLLSIKRQKMIPVPSNTVTLRSSFPSPTGNDRDNDNLGPDDPRKKQIRDSNREAARRCRERRRQYIEQLEGNLEQYKMQIKQTSEKLTRAERENTQLRAIITETKIFHSSTRLSSNDSIVDFANVITSTNGNEINSDGIHHQFDGNNIQRNYITRNTH